ncbi:MAG: amidase family protein [Acidobacteriota bacterium]|nr:amidase family protein [Acidobacteriota bacterium]
MTANNVAGIPDLSACELARRVGDRDLSAADVAEACLARVAERNPDVNAVVTVNPRAVDEARAVDERVLSGERGLLLAGVPVGIKDVTPVAGLRTTYGSKLYAEHVADEDAEVVRRLRAAGAVILGKTNTPEFATGANTFNDVFGRTHNPWHLGLSAGGSTGGGAAGLATGMFAVAEGTDLGGSLRIPAAFCGVVGLRPSPGLVPTWPSDYLWDTLQVSGPMAREAGDVALALQAMAGPGGRSPIVQPVEGRDFSAAVAAATAVGLRVAYVADIADIGVDPKIERVCREAAFALADEGARVEEIELDLAYGKEAFLDLRGYWMVAQHESRLDRSHELGDLLRGNLEAGLRRTTAELARSEAARRRLWEETTATLAAFDVVLTATVAVPPFPVTESYPRSIAGRPMKTYVDWIAPTFVLSLAGLPIVSVPAGLDDSGLPVGIQIMGPPRGEETVLALAACVQALRPIGAPAPPGPR